MKTANSGSQMAKRNGVDSMDTQTKQTTDAPRTMPAESKGLATLLDLSQAALPRFPEAAMVEDSPEYGCRLCRLQVTGNDWAPDLRWFDNLGCEADDIADLGDLVAGRLANGRVVVGVVSAEVQDGTETGALVIRPPMGRAPVTVTRDDVKYLRRVVCVWRVGSPTAPTTVLARRDPETGVVRLEPGYVLRVVLSNRAMDWIASLSEQNSERQDRVAAKIIETARPAVYPDSEYCDEAPVFN